jgi:hypothetical protein
MSSRARVVHDRAGQSASTVAAGGGVVLGQFSDPNDEDAWILEVPKSRCD